jgi:hypothetical protein
MRYALVGIAMIGCGSVKDGDAADAPGAPIDEAACAGTTVEACGTECATCESSDDRAGLGPPGLTLPVS